jgi:hypothetical protein
LKVVRTQKKIGKARLETSKRCRELFKRFENEEMKEKANNRR